MKGMAQEKHFVDEENVERLLQDSYSRIKSHDVDTAIHLLERALSLDFDNGEVVASLKLANFWKERQDTADSISTPFEKGEYLLSQWRPFQTFLERVGSPSEQSLYAIRQHVFGQALGHFERLQEEAGGGDVELLLRVGRCYKGVGQYDRALEQLQEAARQRKEDAEILAELADCYALVNEVQISKAFFREAFFIAPQRVDLFSLESEMIRRLVAKVKDLGYRSPALEEWVPVFGVLYGVFTVKRELRSIEYGKLKQSIYALERERQDRSDNEDVLMPRLINRYFWLIDHYVSTGEDRGRIDEVLLKLRTLNPAIYQQYTA
jgi:tetratricopeptide (TPR) repeat protein